MKPGFNLVFGTFDKLKNAGLETIEIDVRNCKMQDNLPF